MLPLLVRGPPPVCAAWQGLEDDVIARLELVFNDVRSANYIHMLHIYVDTLRMHNCIYTDICMYACACACACAHNQAPPRVPIGTRSIYLTHAPHRLGPCIPKLRRRYDAGPKRACGGG